MCEEEVAAQSSCQDVFVFGAPGPDSDAEMGDQDKEVEVDDVDVEKCDESNEAYPLTHLSKNRFGCRPCCFTILVGILLYFSIEATVGIYLVY